jgi:hypothetical protein
MSSAGPDPPAARRTTPDRPSSSPTGELSFARLRPPDLLVGLAGVALVALLFTGWYSAGHPVFKAPGARAVVAGPEVTLNAWQALSGTDIALAVLGGAAVALALVTMGSPTTAIPTTFATVLLPFALAGVALTIWRTVDVPITGLSVRGPGWGALGDSVVLFGAVYWAVRDERVRGLPTRSLPAPLPAPARRSQRPQRGLESDAL